MLQLADVVADYGGAPVLTGVRMSVGAGEIVAVLGRNGAGKTTLMRTIMGLLPTKSGRLTFDDQDIGHLSAHIRAKRGIGYVPQGRLIFPRMTVLDNVRVAALATADRRTAARRVADVIERFPILQTRRSVLGGSLSGGQQQILAVARAMATSPKLLLLDEPTEGIQPTIVDEIAIQLKSMNRDLGLTVLLVEQRLEFANALAQRAYVLDRGQVVLDILMEEFARDVQLQHQHMGV